MDEKRPKTIITEIKHESFPEKIFRVLAVLAIIIFPVMLLFCFRVVKQYKRAVILRFGRIREDSPAGPGIIWVIPCTDNVVQIDLRTQSFNLLPQEILTKDSVTVTVDAVVYYHVLEPLNCLLNVQSYEYSTELIAVSTLRNIMGQYTLTDLLSNRGPISYMVRTEIDKVTAEWGVEVERVEIKDVLLPYELQKAMASEAEGTRLAKAKIIEAEGEIKTAENLREASRLMMGNPQVMMHHNKVPQYSFQSLLIFLNQTVQDIHVKHSPKHYNIKFEFMLLNEKDTIIEKFLVILSIIIVMLFFPLSMFCIFLVVRQFERAVILRNGKVHQNKAFGPGLVFYLPCVDTFKYIDLRIICYAVPPQEALTKDSLTVSVDAVVYYKIYNLIWAVINVADFKVSTQYLAATTLRNVLGTKKLAELLSDRPAISRQVFHQLKNMTREWGVKVLRVEIKDIRLPLQLQKAMAAEAESSRLANAKIIVANAEIDATKSLKKATDMLLDNPLCMQLRYLQSLQMIAGDQTHTIVVPFSLDMLKKIFK